MDKIVAIAQAIMALLPFASEFGLIKYICSQCDIFGIEPLDKALFWIAGTLATVISAAIAKHVPAGGKVKLGLSILTYFVILSLFASKVFWYIVIAIVVVMIVFGIWSLIVYLRQHKEGRMDTKV